MKITVKKIRKELEKNYGWILPNSESSLGNIYDLLIKDTTSVVNDIMGKENKVSLYEKFKHIKLTKKL